MRNIINALSVAFLLYIFTFYIDGEMGVIIIAFLVFALLVSFALAIYGRNRVRIDFDCDSYVKKGSDISVNVNIEKSGRFPLPIIEIKFCTSEVFADCSKVYRISLVNDDRVDFTFTIPTVLGGNGEISVKSVYSCGFLGFFRFKSKLSLPQPKSVGVIPVIPDIKSSTQLFRSIADSVMTSENDEENDTSMLYSANTAPGYEHREYVHGDSLKRINWKLSSKKSKLMIRLDEAASAVQPVVILDLFRSNNIDIRTSLIKEEKLLQAVFGLVTLLIKQGIACTFIYKSYNGEIVSESVDNPDYPSQLLLKVLSVKVSDERINLQHLTENICACVVASTDFTEDFYKIISMIPDKDNVSGIAPAHISSKCTEIPIWYLDDDNNFKLV